MELFDVIKNKEEREIVNKLMKSYPKQKNIFLSAYDKYKTYKLLMKNNNIYLKNYFEGQDSYTFNSFEKFNDDVENSIILNNARKLKRSVLGNKYRYLENDKTEGLFVQLSSNNIEKNVVKNIIGKKISSYNKNESDNFNNDLANEIDKLLNWNINKYKKQLLSADDIIFENEHSLLLDMNDFERTSHYGSPMWCIKREQEYLIDYTLKGYRFYNYVDFNRNSDDIFSHIAFVVDFDGNIVDGYLKNDQRCLDYLLDNFSDIKFEKYSHKEKIEHLVKNNCFKNNNIVERYYNNSFYHVDDNFYSQKDDYDNYTIDELDSMGELFEAPYLSEDDSISLFEYIYGNEKESNRFWEEYLKYNTDEEIMFFNNLISKKIISSDKKEILNVFKKLKESYDNYNCSNLTYLLFFDSLENFNLKNYEYKKELLEATNESFNIDNDYLHKFLLIINDNESVKFMDDIIKIKNDYRDNFLDLMNDDFANNHKNIYNNYNLKTYLSHAINIYSKNEFKENFYNNLINKNSKHSHYQINNDVVVNFIEKEDLLKFDFKNFVDNDNRIYLLDRLNNKLNDDDTYFKTINLLKNPENIDFFSSNIYSLEQTDFSFINIIAKYKNHLRDEHIRDCLFKVVRTEYSRNVLNEFKYFNLEMINDVKKLGDKYIEDLEDAINTITIDFAYHSAKKKKEKFLTHLNKIRPKRTNKLKIV